MQKEFLAFYHDELQTLRQRATVFSRTYPEAAAKLRLVEGLADDPHVERLIESFAFISARIRHKLEDSFPELSAGLIEAIYPHLLAPRPAMSLVSLVPSPDLTAVQRVPRGFELLSDDVNGDKCRFRTTQAVDLIPAKIIDVRYETDREVLSSCPFDTAQSALIISLSPLKTDGHLGAAGLKTLRFHLSGTWEQASLLYMRILANAVGISLCDTQDTEEPVFLSSDHIVPAGLADEESLLQPSAHFHTGLRLLSEFFALKRKFLFFDISGLENWQSKKLTLTIYLDRQDSALRKNLTADSISLNTTPVINLFQQRCEPVHVNGEREQYPFVPDYRFRQSRKFHSVDCVTAVSENGATILCHPAGHAKICSGSSNLAWQIVRDSSPSEDEDCMIGFSGSALDRGQSFVARIEALCTNGQLPNQLPYKNGSLQLLPAKPHSMIAAIRCLMPFTSSVAKPLSGDQLWRFIAHLRVNHLSISNDTGQTLREILRLYQANEDADGQKFIDSVQSVTPRSSMYRLRQGGFAAATDFDICFSADTISPAGIFIFASVLNRFLQLYTSINSFSRVTARMENLAEPVVRFPFCPSIRKPV